MICVKFTAFCDLRADLRIRLATLRKSVRKSAGVYDNYFWRLQHAKRYQGLKAYEKNQIHFSSIMFHGQNSSCANFSLWGFIDLCHGTAALLKFDQTHK